MWIEVAFQLFIIGLGYALGAGAALLAARLAGAPLEAGGAGWLVLLVPAAAALVAEATTGLWLRTPGTMGLGGLVAFVPLLLAGLAAALAALVAQHAIGLPDAAAGLRAGRLTAWMAVAVGVAVVALLLWRYWPEPRARLW